jgi:hypothetical protein
MTTGRFDVVVVGARARGSQAVVELATAVGRITGLAPGAVQRGLEGGEVVVHQGLSKMQAVVAARTVQQLGAIVDVRPAKGDDGAIVVEPDGAEDEPVEPPAASPPAPPRAPPRPEPPPTPAGPGATIDPHAPVLALDGPPVAPRFEMSGPAETKLEIDFGAAGLTAAPPGTSALTRGAAVSTPSGAITRPSGSFPALDPSGSMRTAVPSGPHPIAHAPAVGLIVEDRLASGLIGGAIAATLGMLVAFAVVRSDAKSIADRLEPELADSIADPIGVDAGRRRAPAVVHADIDAGLADVRGTYFTIWAAIAVPLGAAAGLLKRPIR